ncbi:hypothetical protein D0B54_18020 [Solimonas sp. K1W22B-7]|uniref:toxin glutamine deamidase domain-containing protein n=1 Tax=Solimonas sp. K1W22B-7 TaxID=2303331 RepID=UPI000E3336F1|nr:toxin glutamine deamidase domain-containing protein [Solimonas sp. K1W22B-7]AXQ30457.1 hypothetical protein D0B54_18020 [Solimonas sp. K1W22B-7]
MTLIPYKGPVLPPGFVLDPPPAPPRRDAPPQRQALLGPDYGKRFLQDSLGLPADTPWLPAVEDPGWTDRARQGFARLRQRNSAEQALQLVDYMEGLRSPEVASESVRSAIPTEPGRRRVALRNTEQLFSELVQRTAAAQRDQEAIPDSDFLRQWRRTDAAGAAKLAWEHRGAAVRDLAVPAAVEFAPTALKMVIGGGMIRKVGAGLGLGAKALGRAALGGAVFVGADDGYEAGVSSEMFYQLQRRGIDIADPVALGAAFRNRALMSEAMKPARKAGIISAGASAGGTVLAGRVFARSAAGPIARELTNASVQIPAQAALGGTADALSQKLARGEIDWKNVIAAAIGPALLAPVGVATAAAGGYQQRRYVAKEQDVVPPLRESIEHDSGTARRPIETDHSGKRRGSEDRQVPDASAEAYGGSVPKTNPGFPDVGRTHNCVNCAVALDATFSGRPASGLPHFDTKGMSISEIPKAIQGKAGFTKAASLEEITAMFQKMGPGAKGIVFADRGPGIPGHVFNVVVDSRGVVKYRDGQRMGEPLLSGQGYKRFQWIRSEQ